MNLVVKLLGRLVEISTKIGKRVITYPLYSSYFFEASSASAASSASKSASSFARIPSGVL